MRKRCFLSGLLLAAGLLGLVACSPDKPAFRSVDITGAEYARDFSLSDQDDHTRTLRDFSGKVVLVFFGYTQCPDVCPTTLQEMLELKRQLGPEGDRMQVVFVTVDPERDTQALLKAYMANFDPGFVALRPSPAQLPTVLKDFKIYAKKVEGKTPTSYTMDHSAQTYLYDPQGRLRLFSRYGAGVQPLLDDVRLLLKGQ
jgi:protein SCO1/2